MQSFKDFLAGIVVSLLVIVLASTVVYFTVVDKYLAATEQNAVKVQELQDSVNGLSDANVVLLEQLGQLQQQLAEATAAPAVSYLGTSEAFSNVGEFNMSKSFVVTFTMTHVFEDIPRFDYVASFDGVVIAEYCGFSFAGRGSEMYLPDEQWADGCDWYFSWNNVIAGLSLDLRLSEAYYDTFTPLISGVYTCPAAVYSFGAKWSASAFFDIIIEIIIPVELEGTY